MKEDEATKMVFYVNSIDIDIFNALIWQKKKKQRAFTHLRSVQSKTKGSKLLLTEER